MTTLSWHTEEELLRDDTSSNNIVETNEHSKEIIDIVPVKSHSKVDNGNTEKSMPMEEETNSEAKNRKISDEDINLSVGDICRICHMGSFPPLTENRPIWEWQSRRQHDSSQMSILSYGYLGPLISACKCRGTVGLVHAECLERWLTESGHTRCELCGHKFATKRVPRYNIVRSVLIWFNTVVATRQMFLDVLYLIVTTPLALFSCYICAVAMKLLYTSRFKDIPWSVVAMLPTCSLTLAAYWGWILTLSRLHGRRWHRYWRNNFVIQLVPENATVNRTEESRTENSVDSGTLDAQRNGEDSTNDSRAL